MRKIDIKGLNEPGSYFIPHSQYYHGAIVGLDETRRREVDLAKRQADLMQEYTGEFPADVLESYVYQFVAEDSARLNLAADSTVIFSCMSIEAFLNFYGCKRLGDQ